MLNILPHAYVLLSLVKVILSTSELPLSLEPRASSGKNSFISCISSLQTNLYMLQHTTFQALSTLAGFDYPDQPHPRSPAMLPLPPQQLYLSSTPSPSCVAGMLWLCCAWFCTYWLDTWAWPWICTPQCLLHLSLDGWPALAAVTKPALLFFIRCCGTVHLAHEIAPGVPSLARLPPLTEPRQ